MDKPILFQDRLVNQIVLGNKTQTRRIIRPKHIPMVEAVVQMNGKWVWHTLEGDLTTPWGKPGDRLWVRQAWAYDPIKDKIVYRSEWLGSYGIRWKPSIHMKKRYCQIWLEITDIRAHRIQEISHDDARWEGFPYGGIWHQDEILEWFEKTWDEINGEKEGCSWADNPWVWAISFKRVDPGRKDYPGTKYAEIKT